MFIEGTRKRYLSVKRVRSWSFPQNCPLAIETDSTHAGSIIEDCILSYKSDFTLDNSQLNSTLHVPFYDRFQSN